MESHNLRSAKRIPKVAKQSFRNRLINLIITFVLIISGAPSSIFLAAPANAACVTDFPTIGWQAIRTTTGTALTDTTNEFTPYPKDGTADISSVNGSPMDWFSSGTGCDFFFRIRLKGDPRKGTGLDNNVYLLALGRSSTSIVWTGINGNGNNTASEVYVYNPSNSSYISQINDNSNDGSNKIKVSADTVGATTEYLLQWRVANSLLPSSVFSSPVGFFAGTSQSNVVTTINADCINSLQTAGACTPTYTGTLAADLTVNTDAAVRPTITSISPDKGPVAGGTSVTISGTNLTNASQVYFGGTTATINSSSNTSISVVVNSPSQSRVGTVDVQVVTPGGTSIRSNAFTYYDAPVATSVAASGISATRGSLNGTINANSDSTSVSFCYGTDSNLSPCMTVTATPSPVTGTTTTPVSYELTGLTTGVPIYYRVIGTNSGGTTNGSILNFTPANAPLSITNSSLSNGTVGQEYFVSLEATGGSGVYSLWEITSGTLPSGLTFDGTVGHITGTPTVTASSTSLTFRVRDDAAATATKTLTLTIVAGVPTATTSNASSIAATSATLNGSISANGASTSIYFCLSKSGGVSAAGALTCESNPTASSTSTSTSATVTASATSLTSGTLYFFQVYATNSAGTTYGKVLTFVPASAPSVTTSAASSVGASSATLNGSVTANGSSASIYFCLATSNSTNASGALTCVSNPTASVTATLSSATVTASAADLTSSTVYYFQIYSTNSTGTTYGSVLSFTTSSLSPALTPTFDTPVKTNGGFTVNVTNYDSNYTFSHSVSAGSVSAGTAVGSTLPLTVTGLSSGASATITTSTSRTGYNNGSATVSGSAKTNQTVTWSPTATYSFSDRPVTWSANASTSGDGAITYAVTTAGAATCSIDGSGKLTWTSTGTCVVTATAASTTNYNQGTTTVTFTISDKLIPVITLTYTDLIFGDSSTVNPTFSKGSSDANSIVYSRSDASTSICSVNVSTGVVTILQVGNCVVTVSVSGGVTYEDGSATDTLTISNPTTTTKNATNLEKDRAKMKGESNRSLTEAKFCFKNISFSSKSECDSGGTQQDATLVDSEYVFDATDLDPSTTYHFILHGKVGGSIFSGSVKSFKTLPDVLTRSASSVAARSAKFNARVSESLRNPRFCYKNSSFSTLSQCLSDGSTGAASTSGSGPGLYGSLSWSKKSTFQNPGSYLLARRDTQPTASVITYVSYELSVSVLSPNTTYYFIIYGDVADVDGVYATYDGGVQNLTTLSESSGGSSGGTDGGSGGSGGSTSTPVVTPGPRIDSISKTLACYIGTELIISGSYFDEGRVSFDGVSVVIRDISGSTIKVALPLSSAGRRTITVTTPYGSAVAYIEYVSVPKPVFEPIRIPYLSQGASLNLPFIASNATSYGVTSKLPNGLSINATTGVISGTPRENGIFVLTLTASNICGETQQIVELDIDSPTPNAISHRINFTPNSCKIPDSAKASLEAFLEKVKRISPRNIIPEIYVSGGGKAGDPNSPLADCRQEAICDFLLLEDLLGEVLDDVFTGAENRVEIIVYWPRPNDG